MKAQKIIVSLVAILLLLFTVWMTFRMGMPLYSLAVLTVPIAIFFMNHPKLLYGGIICTCFSKLTFPGLPSTLYIFHLLILLALGIHILNRCITKQDNTLSSKTRLWTWLFTINIGLIIAFRGAGLRVLGDENWGGMRYAEVLIPMSLLFLSPQFVFTPREWKKIFVLFILFSILPMLSEMVFLLSGGAIYHQFYLINFNMSTLNSAHAQAMGNELVRFQSANKIGPILLMLSSGFFIFRKINPLSLGIYFSGFLLVGLTGHRSGLIDIILITFISGLIYFKDRKTIYFIFTGLIMLFGLFLVYQIAYLLPLTFQRALMLLPNIEVSQEAQIDAMVTVDWRLDLWKEALNEIRLNPQYLIIGKGLTYSSSEYMALMYFDFNYWWAILTSNYHQGILSLLIISGIPGFIITGGLFWAGLKEHFAFHRSGSESSLLTSMHFAITIYAAILVVKFYLVYGDITGYLPMVVYMFFVLSLLRQTISTIEDRSLPQVGY